LTALGERLHADAQRLGKTYPSCQPPMALLATLEQRTRRQWFVRAWIVGLATSAALLLTAVTILTLWTPTTSRLTATPVTSHAADLVDHESVATASAAVQPVSYRPALADVNGPELEGLLDLMDEQPQSAAVISF
jgi:hypothetical protein